MILQKEKEKQKDTKAEGDLGEHGMRDVKFEEALIACTMN
jgi:hypothetical protein